MFGGGLTSSVLLDDWYGSTTSTTNGIYPIWIRQQWQQSQLATTTIWTSWTQQTQLAQLQRAYYSQAQDPRHYYGDCARVEPAPRPHDSHILLKEKVERERAEARADELLITLLDPDQRRAYSAARYFDVVCKSGRRYRLTRKVSGGVLLLAPDGKIAATYCAHLSGSLPVPDHLIAQKFMLEHHEEEFLRVANRS